MSNIDVIGFGAMNVDYIYQVDETVIDSEQLITNSASVPGGSAANTIYGLAKLGIKTGFIGAIGSDDVGNKLIEDFKSVGVDTSQIQVKQAIETGSTRCFSDQMSRRALYVSQGANNLLTYDDISLPYMEQAKIVHFSSFVDDRQFSIQVNTIKDLDSSTKISFAPGMLYAAKGLETIIPILSRTHIAFFNRNEIERLTGKDFRDGARECLASGCQIIVITLGKGLTLEKSKVVCCIYNSKKEYKIKSAGEYTKHKLETTGAGDAFAAGFLLGFLKDKEIEECGLLGDLTAHFAISHVGARAGLPSLSQLSLSYLELTGQSL